MVYTSAREGSISVNELEPFQFAVTPPEGGEPAETMIPLTATDGCWYKSSEMLTPLG